MKVEDEIKLTNVAKKSVATRLYYGSQDYYLGARIIRVGVSIIKFQ